jgi:hypothetical protein
VSANGGPIRKITSADGWHNWPSFLPDGEHFIYTIAHKDPSRNGIYLSRLGETSERRISTIASRGFVSRDGFLFFRREGSLVRQRFNLEKLEVEGEPVGVAERVFGFAATLTANFTTSADGSVIAYQQAAPETQLLLKDRGGRNLGLLLDSIILRQFSCDSRDKRIAYDRVDEVTQSSDVWLFDLERKVNNRVTSNPHLVAAPVWVNDRELVVTEGNIKDLSGPPQLARRVLGETQTHFLMQGDGVEYPTSYVATLNQVIYTVNRGGARGPDIEMLSLSGDGKKTPLAATDYNERDGRVSPDGRWMAFESDESGQPDIYLTPLGRYEDRVRVSREGGTEARWSRDGRELYFVSAAGMLTAVTVSESGALGTPDPLFLMRAANLTEFGEFGQTRYQPMRDGRFIVREPPEASLRAPIVVMIRSAK